MRYTLLLLAFLFIELFSQTNHQDLYNDHPLTAWTAVKAVRNNHDTTAIPVLIDILEKKPPFLQLHILRVLHQLGDKGAEARTLAFIKRADGFKKHTVPLDPLEAKVDATEILFNMGNFSTYNYVFEMLNREKPKIFSTCIKLLPGIMKNVPEKREEAKKELIFILDNNKESYYRLYAMKYLYEEFGKDIIVKVKERLEKDTDPDIKKLASEYIR
jgi:hypothetical protein